MLLHKEPGWGSDSSVGSLGLGSACPKGPIGVGRLVKETDVPAFVVWCQPAEKQVCGGLRNTNVASWGGSREVSLRVRHLSWGMKDKE